MEDRLFYLLLSLPAFVSALTIHEFAHAWTANHLGDDTPRGMGRLTLDPLAHLDPFGSLMLVVAALSGFPLLGWAKPVPFQPRNLKDPRMGTIMVAVAGPISNLVQALIWLMLLWVCSFTMAQFNVELGGRFSIPKVILTMMIIGVLLNVTLAAFNMIPIPPLDGHYVLEGLGPPAIAELYQTIRPFSFMILLVLINTPIINGVIEPFRRVAFYAIDFALGPIMYLPPNI